MQECVCACVRAVLRLIWNFTESLLLCVLAVMVVMEEGVDREGFTSSSNNGETRVLYCRKYRPAWCGARIVQIADGN